MVDYLKRVWIEIRGNIQLLLLIIIFVLLTANTINTIVCNVEKIKEKEHKNIWKSPNKR